MVPLLVVGGCTADGEPPGAAPTAGPSTSRGGPPGNPAQCQALATLTFDDGPLPDTTVVLLSVLDRLGVQAAFFVEGQRVEKYPSVVAQIVGAGHTIGNHTYSHEDLTTLTPAQIRSTLERTDEALEDAGAPANRLVRLPYGRDSPTVQAVLNAGDLIKVGWNTPANDGNPAASADLPSTLAKRVLGRLRPTRWNVVLMHDGSAASPQSIRAVRTIVTRARKRGYCFVGMTPTGQPAKP